MSEELLPCPFCNHAQINVRLVGGFWRLDCEYCGTVGARAAYKEDAIEKWNRRTTPPATLWCAKCGDGLDAEAVCSVCYDTLESAYDEVVAKLDATPPAVPVDVDYTIRVALEVMRRRAVDVAAVDEALAFLDALQPRPGKETQP